MSLYVPAFLNVYVHCCPVSRLPESNEPAASLAVCEAVSRFLNVTEPPTGTDSVLGLNAKSLIVTSAGEAVGAAAVVDDESADAARRPIETAATAASANVAIVLK